MNAPFPSLVRFYVSSIYGLPALRRAKRGPRAGAGEGAGHGAEPAAKEDPKARAKRVLKGVGIAALAVLVVADLGVLFAAMNFATYDALKPAGMQGLLLLNAATTASMLVFMIGFITALSTYCASKAETYLLALPIASRPLLAAKMIMVYISELAMAFLLMAVATVIYGVREKAPGGFYIYALLASLTLPLVPLSLAYLILVPLMSAGKLLRNKNAVMLVGGVLGLAFALLFNVYIQGASARLADRAWILANYAGPDAIIARIGSAYPPASLAWSSLSKPDIAGILPALANLALGLAAAALVVFLLGPAYARSLLGFDEQSFKRLSDKEAFIARMFRRRRPMTSLVLREIRLMNREPVYLLNGPFVPVLMPLIFAIMYFAQRERLSELLVQLEGFREGAGAFLVAAAAGAFLGSSTSISCTAVSRDAKALPYLKALPISYGEYALAKFLHGFVFSAYGALIGAVGVGLFMALPALELAGSFAIALAFSAMTGIGGLWLDTANPRLRWDNPIAALKQNPNSVIVILGTMGLIGSLGALSATLSLGKLGFFLVYGGVPAAIAAAALAAYPRYAEKRIALL